MGGVSQQPPVDEAGYTSPAAPAGIQRGNYNSGVM